MTFKCSLEKNLRNEHTQQALTDSPNYKLNFLLPQGIIGGRDS